MSEKSISDKITEELDKILMPGWKLINTKYKCAHSEKLVAGAYQLLVAGREIASFELVPMINCCGILVSTQAYVDKAWRGQGLGRLLNTIRIDIARFLGYGVLLCTDVESNASQRKILQANGWKDIHKFVNPRTNNTIFISVINL